MWFGLAANATLAIGTSTLAGGLFEMRRRRKRSLWQLRISDLLAITFAVCLILGLPQFLTSSRRRDEHRVNAMSEDFPGVINGYTFGSGR